VLDQSAQRASFLASSPLFFIVCAGVVLTWAVRLVVGASDRFESATAGLMSAMTLILVAVLKNSELRTERALQTKLDAIAGSLLQDRRGHEGDAENQLERSTGVHEEIQRRESHRRNGPEAGEVGADLVIRSRCIRLNIGDER
jgi:low affinity Fe/Cu permease